jgi:hypothetical protein
MFSGEAKLIQSNLYKEATCETNKKWFNLYEIFYDRTRKGDLEMQAIA